MRAFLTRTSRLARRSRRSGSSGTSSSRRPENGSGNPRYAIGRPQLDQRRGGGTSSRYGIPEPPCARRFRSCSWLGRFGLARAHHRDGDADQNASGASAIRLFLPALSARECALAIGKVRCM